VCAGVASSSSFMLVLMLELAGEVSS